jgi:hypothetical protein
LSVEQCIFHTEIKKNIDTKMSKTNNAKPESPPDLVALCPKTPPDQLLCAVCSVFASRWRLDRQFDWGRVLYCNCGKSWVVCGFCSSRKAQTRMTNARSISAHNRNCHTKKRASDSCNTNSPAKKGRLKRDDDDSSDDEAVLDVVDENEPWLEARSSPSKEKKEDSLLYCKDSLSQRDLFPTETGVSGASKASLRDFGNAHSSSYFNSDINGSGVADIVSLSQFGLSQVGKEIHPADVQYCTDLANFVHGLSQSQRSDLSHILQGTVSKVNRDSTSMRLWKTTIPTTPFAMRKQFWEGSKSFLGNIPYPTVESVDEHAYVSLRECIRNRLAFGFPLEKLEIREENEERYKYVRSLMQSEHCQRIIRKCQELYDEPVLILLLKEWQDGYDPRSFSKANRGSAWLKTTTISEPHENRNGREVSV